MTMRLVVCSLKTDKPQRIAPRTYTTVRFPFGAESYDPNNRHTPLAPPNPKPVTASMPEAGLIWPMHTAWATWQGFMIWQSLTAVASSARPTQFRHRLARDPFGYTDSPMDTTATTNEPVAPPASTSGATKTWGFWAHPGTPVAYQVWHDADVPLSLTVAEFKMSYWVNEPDIDPQQ